MSGAEAPDFDELAVKSNSLNAGLSKLALITTVTVIHSDVSWTLGDELRVDSFTLSSVEAEESTTGLTDGIKSRPLFVV